MELNFTVRVEPDLPVVVPEAVSFETGATKAQATDATLHVYEHHGEEFGPEHKGALSQLFEDLCSGRPFPLTFATRRIADFDTLFAIALFVHRDIATHPSAPGLYASVDMVHRLGDPFLGHLDPNLDRFLRFLRGYFPKGLTRREVGDRLQRAIGWIREYVHTGQLPHLGAPAPAPTVLDIGTNGFVLAQASGQLFDAWLQLFRLGYLKGVVLGPDKNSRRDVLMAKKAPIVDFHLAKAARVLNEMEHAMGEAPEWELSGVWLRSPPEGTLILPTHLVELLLRV